MRIQIDNDLNILREHPPEPQTIIIDEPVGDLNEALDMCGRALLACGYCFKGHLEVVDEED
jgi:hypothetical protein